MTRGQRAERAPVVLAAVGGLPRAALSAAAAAAAALQLRQLDRQRPPRRWRGRIATISVPDSPKRSTAGVIRIGREREAGVAADAEEAHARAAAVARGVVGVARALGVEGGDAEAADARPRAR